MPPNNPLSLWGNDKTMNLNTLVLTNIQSSPYFKVNLFELKTYHEVIDEIYYRVNHLEPWEKGSRKTAGQTGMCGGVRGVGAGGIVSSAYCLLFKLFTLKLTKKQVIGLINHQDSPYIRGLGFMYIRYTQPPADLWPWFEDYLDDEEEIDVKAGGGHIMTIGEMLRQWLVKLEWYCTLFPRIPVPIQKDIAVKLKSRPVLYNEPEPEQVPAQQSSYGEGDKRRGYQDNGHGNGYQRDDGRGDSYRRDDGRGDSYRRDEGRGDSYRKDEGRGDSYYGRDGNGRHGGGDYDRNGEYRSSRGRSPVSRRSPQNHRSRQSSPHRSSASRRSPHQSDYSNSYEQELARERDRQRRDFDKRRSRSRSPRDRKEMRHDGRDASHDRDRKSRRSRSRDRGDRSHNRDRKERRSHSREYRKSGSDGRERKERRSHSRDRDSDRHGSSKHGHRDRKDKYRDDDRREKKSHKHRSRDDEYY